MEKEITFLWITENRIISSLNQTLLQNQKKRREAAFMTESKH